MTVKTPQEHTLASPGISPRLVGNLHIPARHHAPFVAAVT
jgi:hypothetical protein